MLISLNKKEFLLFISEVQDEKKLFKELLEFLSGDNTSISFWGKIPKYIRIKIENLKAKSNVFRKFILRECKYKLLKGYEKAFYDFCDLSYFKEIQWDIVRNENTVLMARGIDDIVISTADIEKRDLERLGNSLHSHGIISKFELIEDPDYDATGGFGARDMDSEVDPTQVAKTEGRSPRTIVTTTFSDELSLFYGPKAKIFAVSGKDRGAVAMAGHMGKAFWYSTTNGQFASSSYYYKDFPGWVS